ncbi:MAG: hypothetical protein ACLFST_13250 [Spirochaetia bacterium]
MIFRLFRNYRRRIWNSSAAVFWMYNDSRPATHSWTILDYYLRRKAAFSGEYTYDLTESVRIRETF